MFQWLRTLLGLSPTPVPLGDETELRRVLYEFTDLLYHGNLVGTLDYLYPKVYEVIPEPEFRALVLKEMEEAAGVDIGNVGTDAISAPYVWEGVEYRLVEYHFCAWLTVVPEAVEPTYQVLKSTYRDQGVTVEDDERIRIDFQRQLYGIYDPAYGDWKVLEKKPEMRRLLHEVLPNPVLRRWPF